MCFKGRHPKCFQTELETHWHRLAAGLVGVRQRHSNPWIFRDPDSKPVLFRGWGSVPSVRQSRAFAAPQDTCDSSWLACEADPASRRVLKLDDEYAPSPPPPRERQDSRRGGKAPPSPSPAAVAGRPIQTEASSKTLSGQGMAFHCNCYCVQGKQGVVGKYGPFLGGCHLYMIGALVRDGVYMVFPLLPRGKKES